MLLGVIGNPDNRRVHLTRRASVAAGIKCQVFAWQDFPRWVPQLTACDLIKIEAAGEDSAVTDKLIALGSAGTGSQPTSVHANKPAALEHGELNLLTEYHLGFTHYLDQLASTNLAFINSPAAIKTMFNKWACHQKFKSANVSRPQSFMAPDNTAEFLEKHTRKTHVGRLFLKPLHGSSASGVLAFKWQDERMQIIAPVEVQRQDGRLTKYFNTLKVRSFIKPSDILSILDHLLPTGMIAEEWLPKAKLLGNNTDMRIVVIAGEARHFVARKSRYPMTNLHLGSERVSEAEYSAAFGKTAVKKCRALAEKAAGCFPDALYTGVDLLLTPDLEPVVVEINAFGDLLPNILHQGESTYYATIKAAMNNACRTV